MYVVCVCVSIESRTNVSMVIKLPRNPARALENSDRTNIKAIQVEIVHAK